MFKSKASCLVLAALPFIANGTLVHADLPLGWISADNPSAYTLEQYGFELSIGGYWINDTLDVADFREDLIGDTDNLGGDTGDINGKSLNFHFGITDYLTAFGSYKEQDITIDLGIIQSAEITDVDSGLSTSQNEIGLRWKIYEANYNNPDNRTTALSLEVSRYESDTDEFDFLIRRIIRPNLSILFAEPQEFSVNNLEDEGWKAKLIYSTALGSSMVGSIWGGLGSSEAKSGTATGSELAELEGLIDQEFKLEEDYYYLGAGLTWHIRPRMPVSLSYEMIRVDDSDLTTVIEANSPFLPSFLRTSVSSEDINHTFNAKWSWWFSPKMNVSVSGSLFSNQFLGVQPHYNNPLSGDFFENPYGFVSVNLGVSF